MQASDLGQELQTLSVGGRTGSTFSFGLPLFFPLFVGWNGGMRWVNMGFLFQAVNPVPFLTK